MMRTALCFFAISLTALGCYNSSPPEVDTAAEPEPVYESWQAAYLQGLKIGHTHTRTIELKRGRLKVFETTRTMHLTVRRYKAIAQVEVELTCEETPEGKVLAMSSTQSLGKGKMITTARVEGKKLLVKSGDKEFTLPWDNRCLGLYAQELAFANKKAVSGDKFSVLSFELGTMTPITLNVVVQKEEKTDKLIMRKGPGGKDEVGREDAKLLRAVIAPGKVKVGGTEVQLPSRTVWLDSKKLPVRAQHEFPGLGTITEYTAPKEVVLKEKINEDKLPDLGLMVMIPLKTTISRPDETRRVTYRVKMKEDIKPPFLEDARQSIKEHKGKTFELHVTTVREPGTDAKAPSPGKEYTESNSLIDSAAPGIKAIAAKVAGSAKAPYKKALLLEKWVHENMTFSADAGLPSASRIAKALQGDCRQHAMLLAALLRAEGIPSRTALGLVYYREEGRSPNFAFHMWTEAYIGGKWLSMDAIRGQGGIAATHLKMAHASWSGVESLAPLLPIAQALGKLEIEIIESK
jgi:transglutaminase-like putative cysteine protease